MKLNKTNHTITTKTLFTVCALALASVTAVAQPPHPRGPLSEEQRELREERMTDALIEIGATDDQIAAFFDIRAQAEAARADVLLAYGFDPAAGERPDRATMREMRPEMQEIRAETKAAMEEVFTAEQLEALKALLPKKRGGRGAHPPQP